MGLRALCNRTAKHARKLATVYACSKDGTAVCEVDAGAVEWATQLSEYLVRRMILIANDWVSANEWESVKTRILRIIRHEGTPGNQPLGAHPESPVPPLPGLRRDPPGLRLVPARPRRDLEDLHA